MSFKCEFCSKTSQPREKLHLVPVQFREKQFRDKGGNYGTDIVKEKRACENCYVTVADFYEIDTETKPPWGTVISSSNYSGGEIRLSAELFGRF